MSKILTQPGEKPKKKIGCFTIFGIATIVFSLLFFIFFVVLLVSGISGIEDTDIPIDTEKVTNGASDEIIAVIPLKGIITSSSSEDVFDVTGANVDTLDSMLEKALGDEDVKAVVIDMDTPGGEVLASDLIYRKVSNLNRQKPVVVWMGNSATSGGYYVASGASKIVAHPETITGSIGVLLQLTNLDGLYKKVGINTKTYKSGLYKTNEILWEGGSEELDAIYQSLIDESYDRFVEIVSKGRGMSEKEVRSIADGRIYSGRQASENGLVDELGLIEDAQALAGDLADLKNPQVVKYKEESNIWKSFNMGTRFGFLSSIMWGGVETEGKTNISVSDPGLKMYYLPDLVGVSSK